MSPAYRQHRQTHLCGRRTATALTTTAALAVVTAACSALPATDDSVYEDPTMHAEITIDESRAHMDAALTEVRPIVEATLGTEGWEQSPASGGTTACGSNTYEYHAPHMLTTKVMNVDQWWRTWPRIREVIEHHGYIHGSEVPTDGGSYHLLTIRNDRGDGIEITNVPGGGFTYGGKTACYPKSPAGQPG